MCVCVCYIAGRERERETLFYAGIASRGSLSRTANYEIMHTAPVPQLLLRYEFALMPVVHKNVPLARQTGTRAVYILLGCVCV